ncbi:hypothetical protein BDQ12DRAFT_689253 [Crucibulum laeve]|uniref:Uncharacterized protein n=1 Tax=Crucibulum laeve TaxID=68775 RepID=A0A5C3LPR2_9AGAR|nr:hypothetical protein BDQ12DRAFT_689253 [Crucibulum laeve]
MPLRTGPQIHAIDQYIQITTKYLQQLAELSIEVVEAFAPFCNIHLLHTHRDNNIEVVDVLQALGKDSLKAIDCLYHAVCCLYSFLTKIEWDSSLYFGVFQRQESQNKRAMAVGNFSSPRLRYVVLFNESWEYLNSKADEAHSYIRQSISCLENTVVHITKIKSITAFDKLIFGADVFSYRERKHSTLNGLAILQLLTANNNPLSQLYDKAWLMLETWKLNIINTTSERCEGMVALNTSKWSSSTLKLIEDYIYLMRLVSHYRHHLPSLEENAIQVRTTAWVRSKDSVTWLNGTTTGHSESLNMLWMQSVLERTGEISYSLYDPEISALEYNQYSLYDPGISALEYNQGVSEMNGSCTIYINAALCAGPLLEITYINPRESDKYSTEIRQHANMIMDAVDAIYESIAHGQAFGKLLSKITDDHLQVDCSSDHLIYSKYTFFPECTDQIRMEVTAVLSALQIARNNTLASLAYFSQLDTGTNVMVSIPSGSTQIGPYIIPLSDIFGYLGSQTSVLHKLLKYTAKSIEFWSWIETITIDKSPVKWDQVPLCEVGNRFLHLYSPLLYISKEIMNILPAFCRRKFRDIPTKRGTSLSYLRSEKMGWFTWGMFYFKDLHPIPGRFQTLIPYKRDCPRVFIPPTTDAIVDKILKAKLHKLFAFLQRTAAPNLSDLSEAIMQGFEKITDFHGLPSQQPSTLRSIVVELANSYFKSLEYAIDSIHKGSLFTKALYHLSTQNSFPHPLVLSDPIPELNHICELAQSIVPPIELAKQSLNHTQEYLIKLRMHNENSEMGMNVFILRKNIYIQPEDCMDQYELAEIIAVMTESFNILEQHLSEWSTWWTWTISPNIVPLDDELSLMALLWPGSMQSSQQMVRLWSFNQTKLSNAFNQLPKPHLYGQWIEYDHYISTRLAYQWKRVRENISSKAISKSPEPQIEVSTTIDTTSEKQDKQHGNKGNKVTFAIKMQRSGSLSGDWGF